MGFDGTWSFYTFYTDIPEAGISTPEPPSKCPMTTENCISGNETITDDNNGTCLALNTSKGNKRFNYLATISSECIQKNGIAFLDIIIPDKTSCSQIESKIYVNIERTPCMSNITLMACKLVDIGSESICRVRCKCKNDSPCQLWLESANFQEQFNICEIITVNGIK